MFADSDKLSDVAARQATAVEPTILLDLSHIEGFANHRRSHLERL